MTVTTRGRRARTATCGRVVHCTAMHCIAVQESDRKEKPKAFRRIVRAKPRDPRVFVALQSFG
ncbi:hypothetical protein A8H31_17940 [Burkholderia thailandensis]|nr:hypothetical protein A8H31_17940 [Burkholderia thailandensis]NOK54717.1 hypothetical protein [Burkholderia thailandensis]PNE69368.1 hypothetical protein A8H38_25870 [Burkholderia thailandensis]